jgi:hypothetical protein
VEVVGAAILELLLILLVEVEEDCLIEITFQ